MAEPAYTTVLPHPEDGHAWPAQGEWTYEDYLRLPEDGQRYEVIRGHLYVTPPPIYDHQYVVSQLHWYVSGFDGKSYVELCRGGVGDVVVSAVLPGQRVPVADLFPKS